MRLSRSLSTIALLSTLSLSAFAQQSGGTAGGGETLRSWCQQQGHQQMCQQAKTDRAAAKSACGGQQQGQTNDACTQARGKFKSDVEALHQAGAARA